MSWLAGEILIVYFPMLRSNAIAYWGPYSFCIVSPVLGDGYGFLTNFCLSLIESVINLAAPSFQGQYIRGDRIISNVMELELLFILSV